MRDLLRVMLLTLVAITLLMTVLAIIQPLRNVGLGGSQVLHLFIFTMPVMLSFTLPVATLFAATLVYGRFAQDNELLACRASGVSTLALLRPALVLGVIVTMISLTLSNVVAPSLSTMAGMVQANVRGILYQRLKTEGHIDIGRGDRRHIIHADDVDPENNMLYGVVYADVRKIKQPKSPLEKLPASGRAFLATASAARLSFVQDPNGSAQVIVQPEDPSVLQAGPKISRPFAPEAQSMQLVVPLDNPVEQKASWYNWADLLRALREPNRHGPIAREIDRIRQLACGDMLGRDIVDTISAGKSYRHFAQGDETFEIEAGAAEQDRDGSAVLKSTADGARGRRVSVVIRRGGRVLEIITARSGKVVVTWSTLTREPLVTLKLLGEVVVDFVGPTGRSENRMENWVRGEIPVPPGIRRRAVDISLADMADMIKDPHAISRNKKVVQAIVGLTKSTIPRFQAALMAELHARVAYGVSCFLMVAMGAALGMLLKGGQFISAFAISAVPAAAVIILLLMGKEMVRNPNVNTTLGLAAIWSGIVALLAANGVIYLVLSRK
jgi:lipopolysaccharide export system permease protein